ncbi:MAG TPA: signal peptidase I [Patescibacteria group bacterium]|nr:signal peptidase I [Patescibacteria group bacterium]
MDAESSSSFKYAILDFIQTLAVAAAISLFIYWFFIQPHRVDGSSMENSFYHEELILTDKISYRLSKPKRGDVIVFQAPNTTDRDYIKRITGLPGESVLLRDGDVYINGQILQESYTNEQHTTNGEEFLKDDTPYLIPDGYYFALGDNREHSSDSRSFGPVQKEKIVGKVWLRYWPPSSMGLIPSIHYPQFDESQSLKR